MLKIISLRAKLFPRPLLTVILSSMLTLSPADQAATAPLGPVETVDISKDGLPEFPARDQTARAPFGQLSSNFGKPVDT